MNDSRQLRDVEIPFEKLGLEPGDQLYLESVDRRQRFLVRLAGYVPGQSIMVLPPERDGRQVLFKQDRVFNVRMAAGTRVCAFRSWVSHITLQPYALIHLHYPQDFLAFQVRKTERFLISLPAGALLAGEEEARPVTITDLSAAGAGIESAEPLGDEGDALQLRFQITVADVTKALNLQCRIRNRQTLSDDSGERWVYGLGFEQVSSTARIVLNGFIYEKGH